jgi:hypothetical protein
VTPRAAARRRDPRQSERRQPHGFKVVIDPVGGRTQVRAASMAS